MKLFPVALLINSILAVNPAEFNSAMPVRNLLLYPLHHGNFESQNTNTLNTIYMRKSQDMEGMVSKIMVLNSR